MVDLFAGKAKALEEYIINCPACCVIKGLYA